MLKWLSTIDPVVDGMLKNYLKIAEEKLCEFAKDSPDNSKSIFDYMEISDVMSE
jgi:hypothetical protein